MNIFKHRKTTVEGEASPSTVNKQVKEDIKKDAEAVKNESTSEAYQPLVKTNGYTYKMEYDDTLGDDGAFIARLNCSLYDFWNTACNFEIDNSSDITDDMPSELIKIYKPERSTRFKDSEMSLDLAGYIDGAMNISSYTTTVLDQYKFIIQGTDNEIFIDNTSNVNISVCKYIGISWYDIIITPLKCKFKE